MKDWDDAYKKVGKLLTNVIPLVKESVNILKDRKANKVLDLCFGTGRHTIFLVKHGFEVHGIDISEEAKRITEQACPEANLQVGDIHNLPYANSEFDAIIAVHCLHHNTRSGLTKCIDELSRVLKKNGILVMTLVSTKDSRYGKGNEIEPNTFKNPTDLHESDVPHHYSDEKEVDEILTNFKIISKVHHEGFSLRRNVDSIHWYLIVEKSS